MCMCEMRVEESMRLLQQPSISNLHRVACPMRDKRWASRVDFADESRRLDQDSVGGRPLHPVKDCNSVHEERHVLDEARSSDADLVSVLAVTNRHVRKRNGHQHDARTPFAAKGGTRARARVKPDASRMRARTHQSERPIQVGQQHKREIRPSLVVSLMEELASLETPDAKGEWCWPKRNRITRLGRRVDPRPAFHFLAEDDEGREDPVHASKASQRRKVGTAIQPGVFVGMLNVTEQGLAIKTRSAKVRRIPESERWDADRMLGMRAVPWSPDGSDTAFDIQVGMDRPPVMVPRAPGEVLMENNAATHLAERTSNRVVSAKVVLQVPENWSGATTSSQRSMPEED